MLRHLSLLSASGVTSILPGRVRFGWKNDFKVFAPRKHFSVGFEDGVVIHGFWKPEFDGVYYIYKLQEIREGKCVQSGEYFSSLHGSEEEPVKDITQYREMPPTWLNEQKEKPWTAKSNTEINSYGQTNATMPMYMEEVCFYRYAWNIYDFAALAQKQGTELPWSFASAPDSCQRIVFGAHPNGKPNSKTLHKYLSDSLKPGKTLAFVHFKDEQDALCQAQEEFLNMMTLYLTEEHRDLKIVIVDVVIRDRQGQRLYQKEWREYFAQNMLGRGGSCFSGDPSPFVMVLGHISKEAMKNQSAFMRKQGTRLLDVDLFHDCRHLVRETENGRCNWEANDQFRSNFKLAMHEIWRVAGIVGNNAQSIAKDYTRLPKETVKRLCWDLEDHAVIIRIHTRNKDVVKTALTVCNHLKASGCPYVEVVITDGPENIIEVHDDTDMYSECTIKEAGVSSAEGDDDLFWAVEQAARRKYNVHKLGGASPMLVRPEPAKLPDQEDMTPEVFRTLKKPLH